ncbi:hypothetical protein GUJ93_ZPchr0013g37368 [Zizania palustris]|uniref:Leucine-rich repeat-containing N-terminal plant-type domain-containing protein n=1 Tax=Zizania palustris TaxID=103762 RepID=A0A8J6C4W4_ZIZPA|nr:hypothetical protein GUJ93_ZPchr0013g37368 [Zizania palustris]
MGREIWSGGWSLQGEGGLGFDQCIASSQIYCPPPKSTEFFLMALMAIKMELQDPYNMLHNWDINSIDPCSWRMVTCSADGYVSALYASFFIPPPAFDELQQWSLILLYQLCSQWSAQLKLVRQIIPWHWQPHQAAICVITEQCKSGPIPISIGRLEML